MLKLCQFLCKDCCWYIVFKIAFQAVFSLFSQLLFHMNRKRTVHSLQSSNNCFQLFCSSLLDDFIDLDTLIFPLFYQVNSSSLAFVHIYFIPLSTVFVSPNLSFAFTGIQHQFKADVSGAAAMSILFITGRGMSLFPSS